MIVHLNEEKGATFERENWTELFRIVVAKRYIRDIQVIPKGFVLVGSDWNRGALIYYRKFLVPVVRLCERIEKMWWILPTKLYYTDHLAYDIGETRHWFWFPRLRFRKIDRDFYRDEYLKGKTKEEQLEFIKRINYLLHNKKK